MKRARLADEVVPVHLFRAGLADWVRHVESTGRPLVLTLRGRPAAALVSPAALDEMEEEREVVRKVLRGLREVRDGQTVDNATVWAGIDQVIADAEQRHGRALD
jgi:prevent-host-death family protein